MLLFTLVLQWDKKKLLKQRAFSTQLITSLLFEIIGGILGTLHLFRIFRICQYIFGLDLESKSLVPILSRYVFFAKLIALKQSFLNLSTLVLVSGKHPFLRNFLYCLFCFFIILRRLSVIQGGSLGWILTKLLGIKLLAILRNLLLKNSTCLRDFSGGLSKEKQLPLCSSHHCWHGYNAKFSSSTLEEEECGGLGCKRSFGVYKNYQEMDVLHFPLQHLVGHILPSQYRKEICFLQS